MTSRKSVSFGLCALMALACDASAQLLAAAPDLAKDLRAFPVTDEVLKNPNAADWLMYSRTYDAHRYSPLDRDRSRQRRLARARVVEAAGGRPLEIIPLVYRGVMYLTTPGSRDGGSRVWRTERGDRRDVVGVRAAQAGGVAHQGARIYGDMIYYTAPAPSGEPNPVIALDAATGAVRWQTPVIGRDAHGRARSSSRAK